MWCSNSRKEERAVGARENGSAPLRFDADRPYAQVHIKHGSAGTHSPYRRIAYREFPLVVLNHRLTKALSKQLPRRDRIKAVSPIQN